MYDLDSFYEKIWLILNTINLSYSKTFLADLSIPKKLDLNYFSLVEKFQDTSKIKTICLKKIDNENKEHLQLLNLSFKYLMLNFTERIDLVTHDSRQFQDRAISSQFVYAVCPFSGEILRSNQSILVHRSLVFYRFTGSRVFYLAIGNQAAGFLKDAIYFPDLNLVVRRSNNRYAFKIQHLIMLKAITVSQYEAFLNYFLDEDNKKLAILIGHDNFAHHLWNELSGLYRLKQKNLLNKIDKIFVLRETLGHLTEIFPELFSEKVEILKKKSTPDEKTLLILDNMKPVAPEFISEALKNNYFFVQIGDYFIPRGLTQRIHKVAKWNIRTKVKSEIYKAKRERFPLLWISIRTQDRTWISQTEAIIKIINRLAQDFPNLGVIFDGFTFPADSEIDFQELNLTSLERTLITREKEVVQEIIENLDPRVQTFDIIGHSIFEAIVWSYSIDLYLCHFGTLQHKVGWFASKPGVVHSNLQISSSETSQSRTYKVKELAIAPKFIDCSHIQNFVVETSQNDLRSNVDNYDINWCVVYEELEQLILSIQKTRNLKGKLDGFLDFSKKYLISKLSQKPYFKKYIR